MTFRQIRLLIKHGAVFMDWFNENRSRGTFKQISHSMRHDTLFMEWLKNVLEAEGCFHQNRSIGMTWCPIHGRPNEMYGACCSSLHQVFDKVSFSTHGLIEGLMSLSNSSRSIVLFSSSIHSIVSLSNSYSSIPSSPSKANSIVPIIKYGQLLPREYLIKRYNFISLAHIIIYSTTIWPSVIWEK